MAHKTLIGGTVYNITGGKSIVSGTSYNITGGRALIGGTGYNINFGSAGEPTAMLYSDGNFIFQLGDKVENGKTLTASYTNFEDIITAPPWHNEQRTFKAVKFDTEIAPITMCFWFNNARNMIANINNFSNLKMDKVTNMISTYRDCFKLTGSPICGNNVTDMSHTYEDCYSLTGSPVCGNNVMNMFYTYAHCRNLTGSPVCGKNVTNMGYTYYNCWNLRGSPVCGSKVTNMSYTYYNCRNLTGSPVCGKNVTKMYTTYQNCYNLTGCAICGINVTDVRNAYANCTNLSGNAYFYSSKVNSVLADTVRGCFLNKNNAKMLNIYVPSNSNTNIAIHRTGSFSIVGANITWTDAGTYQYNTKYNIYIYPVSNVAATAIANGDEEANANAGIV